MSEVYLKDNPELLDIIIGNIQQGLAENIGWLDKAFGRAERLVKNDPDGRTYYLPAVYIDGNEYEYVTPDSNIGNFCFFWVSDPQEVDWEANISVGIKCPFSLIFWFDMRTVFNSADIRDKEQVKKQILDVLNGGFWLKKGSFRINRIYELAENIYRGFSLAEIDNQYLMQPYCGFRFEGELSITENCII
jgi:hypothetical protein